MIKYLLLLIPMIGFSQLQSSGPISHQDVATEFSLGLGPHSLRTLGEEISIFSGPISLSDFYGESAPPATCPDQITGTLKYHVSIQSCASHNTIIGARYGGTTFQNASGIYTDTSCTPAVSGYYSDGSIWKYWNSTTETFTSNGLCS